MRTERSSSVSQQGSIYSATEGKLAVGLQTISPGKLDILFPEIQPPQKRLAWSLYKRLGANWIEEARTTYHSEENVGQRGNKSVIEALMQKLSSLSQDFFPSSNYTFIDHFLTNICQGITWWSTFPDYAPMISRIVCLSAMTVAEHYKHLWEKKYEG
jgi:hypothetical protein